MSARATRMLASLQHDGPPSAALDRLCSACAAEFDVAGAGVALIVAGEHRGTLSASDDLIAVVEQLQYTLGEGPCVDANRGGQVVAAPDLSLCVSRWPAFAPAALDAGVRAAFAYPLHTQSASFGALDLYRSSPGSLTEGDHDDSRSLADAATSLLLLMQADASPGRLPDAIDALVERRAVVHQAAGMVSVQLSVPIRDALVALRARAFADGRDVGGVAADITTRRLRLEP